MSVEFATCRRNKGGLLLLLSYVAAALNTLELDTGAVWHYTVRSLQLKPLLKKFEGRTESNSAAAALSCRLSQALPGCPGSPCPASSPAAVMACCCGAWLPPS
jgi:hypothetical protein